MDLQAGTIVLALLCIAVAILSVRNGLRTIRSARRMTFYHLRRQREGIGWRQLGLSVLMLVAAAALPVYALPAAYQYFPPSPTPSLTATISPVPSATLRLTITLSPTITDTPVVSDTPTATPTPFIPAAIQALFQSAVTPNPDVVFSPLVFTTAGSAYPPVRAATVFENPVGHVYAIFSYDAMLPGAQWTTLWLRDSQLIHYETKPWDGATGGSGFTDWNPPVDQWQPGIYSVQLFVGEEYIINGRFLVQGDPPTITSTSTPSLTATATLALTSVPTGTPTQAGPGTPRPVPPSPAPATSTP